MGKALYRKYRSKSLDEIVGQDHITTTLTNALKSGKISHAYLLTGPRGVGKTSVARILAHQVNSLPYTDDSLHIDIIEIDAASNRRIDEVRELREKVYVAPTSAKYKVYIIDEVHMLTREAFNALLKTLEEPPEHAIFILATTDVHKLPETIISRTQHYSFKPINKADAVRHLKQIAKTEKIKISDDALELLAEHGEGSFRDSISLLDQASAHDRQIELDDVRHLLGIAPGQAIESLIEAINTGQTATNSLVSTLDGLYDQGYQASSIAKQLGAEVRQNIIDGKSNQGRSYELLEGLIEVPVSNDPERLLELVLLKAMPKSSSSSTISQPIANDIDIPTPPSQQPAPESAKQKPVSLDVGKVLPKTHKSDQVKLDEKSWPKVLKTLKTRHNTLYSIVRMAEPDFSQEGKLRLVFAFGFHQKRLGEDSNQQKLSDTIYELTGEHLVIECLLDKTINVQQPPVTTDSEPKSQDLAAISNIFGEAELLES